MTPEAAVARAFWTVKLPSLVLMIGPWFGFAVSSDGDHIPSVGMPGLKWFLLAFLGGFVAGWLAWPIQTPRWRRWAYQHVDDIEELKREAVAAQLPWPEGHFFERTEIAPRRLREEIRALERAKSEWLTCTTGSTGP
jgi:hypothetical protein